MMPKLTRRTCLGVAGAGMAAATLARPVRADSDPDWQAWKSVFLTAEGRVVDTLQEGVSHSESQGYGLLLTTYVGDADAYGRIRDWTDANLAIRDDPLLAWRWRPGEGALGDTNNASDGDLFYAWALMRGAGLFDAPDDRRMAGDIAAALAEICLKPDPRAPGTPLLLPGQFGFADGGAVTVNLSYIMPLAMHRLAAAFGATALARAADAALSIVREVTAEGLPPDWITIDADGWRAADGWPARYSYDALRVPLWQVWSGRPADPAVLRYRAVLDRFGMEGGAPVAVSLDGAEVLERSPDAGYAAIAALAQGAPVPAYDPNQPYFPATLHLMARIAGG